MNVYQRKQGTTRGEKSALFKKHDCCWSFSQNNLCHKFCLPVLTKHSCEHQACNSKPCEEFHRVILVDRYVTETVIFFQAFWKWKWKKWAQITQGELFAQLWLSRNKAAFASCNVACIFLHGGIHGEMNCKWIATLNQSVGLLCSITWAKGKLYLILKGSNS